jgi:hypothetical protein
LPKKIKFDLLLADLALRRGNAPVRLVQFALRTGRTRPAAPTRSRPLRIARSTGTAQSLWTAGKEAITPDIQILAGKLQLAR